VNLIGEHTDYNEGLALPFAIDRGVTVTASTSDTFEAVAKDLGEHDAFPLDNREPSKGWRAFVRGTVAELQDAGYALRPARLEIEGDLPRGSGLSSSAALSTALALALIALADAAPPDDLRELAKLCSRVENEWVGQKTGLMDQLAALLGSPDHALRIDFRTLEVRPTLLELGEWRLVTVESGASHTLAASGYNERRAECEAACDELGIASLREATADDLGKLGCVLRKRVRHVLTENARVDAMAQALERHELEQAGRLLDASHASLRDDYESSVPEVEETVARIKEQGAAGARMVGGGFGGSVLALLRPDSALPAGAVAVVPGPAARLV
jgi:galactokinase